MKSLSTGAEDALEAFRHRLSSEVAPGTAERTWAQVEATRASSRAADVLARYDEVVEPKRRRWPVPLAAAAAALLLVGAGFVAGRRSTHATETPEGSTDQALYRAQPEDPERARARTRESSAPTTEALETVTETATEPETATETETATEPKRTHRSRRRPKGSARAPNLAEELELMRRAKLALNAEDTAGALELLREHRRGFPHGQMASDRRALELEAKCRKGERHVARARRYLEHHPGSPYAARLRKACEEL